MVYHIFRDTHSFDLRLARLLTAIKEVKEDLEAVVAPILVALISKSSCVMGNYINQGVMGWNGMQWEYTLVMISFCDFSFPGNLGSLTSSFDLSQAELTAHFKPGPPGFSASILEHPQTSSGYCTTSHQHLDHLVVAAIGFSNGSN